MVETASDTKPSASLLVPCRAEYVSLGRLVAGALGAREGLDEEIIADIKVVVTEAFNFFLGGEDGCVDVQYGEEAGRSIQSEPSCLLLDFTVGPDEWVILISNPDRRRRISQASLGEPMSERMLGLTIIEALVDSMERTDSDEE